MWRRCAGVLLLCALVSARHDDDFAFDNSEEFQAEISNSSDLTNGLKRLWGIPDTTAYVGYLFRMEIPNEAFSGPVVGYKVRSADGRRAPSWLSVDSRHGLLSGVPLAQDIGVYTLLVTAHSTRSTAIDIFTIEVKPRSRSYLVQDRCPPAASRMSLLLLLDVHLQQLEPERRTRALMRLANFMARPGDEFYMEAYKPSSSHSNQTILKSGPGTQRRREYGSATAIYLNVGCGGSLWSRHAVLVAGVREQARDGTLAHVLDLPVLGWRLVAEKPVAPVRPRRQLEEYNGSGEYDDNYGDEDEDYSGDGEDEDDYNFETPTDTPNRPSIIPESSEIIPRTSLNITSPRRVAVPGISIFSQPPEVTTTEKDIDIVPGPTVTTTEQPSIKIVAEPSSTEPPVSSTSWPTTPTLSTTSSVQSSTSTTTPTTTPRVTTPEHIVTVTQQETSPATQRTTIDGQTTETVDIWPIPPMSTTPQPPLNQPPQIRNHMKKLRVTAGKAFRYLIPEDIFLDAEDGTNLTYTMYDADNTALKANSWVQFMPKQREVYGLPLDEHVSRWGFRVQAADSTGAAATAPLDITVQHHKGQRTINHQFTLTLKLQEKYRYAIDWQIDVLEGLVNLFRTKDMENFIVREVSSTEDLVKFSWSDETLPTDVCPTADIQRIMGILESDTEKGSPSANLSRVMQPHLKVASVEWAGLVACASTPAPPPAPPHLDTFPPVPRNQVDLVQATAGHLLVFKVPEDTFYDPEDGGTRNLKLSVIRGDRTALPTAHWMQFDQANQEFYGLPTDRDVGKKEYQLIAEDSTGKTANDVLLVEVNPAPQIHPTVEFHMTMNSPYASLAGTARDKRTFLESLATLFGDKDASAIRVKSITDKPTTIVWYNTSLPMDRCPDDEIQQLNKIIIKEDEQGKKESLTDRVDVVLGKHDVMSIRLIPRGQCQRSDPRPPPYTVPGSSSSREGVAAAPGDAGSQPPGLREYIITFIVPAVVVVCMILVAGIIACVLYRRRRTGKMSVGDEEERQAFRSKGIPVIFQDELDEKPDRSNKSPVIMKEEKPPLLPPPDYKMGADSPTPSHHTPYHPPPPFTSARDPRPTSRPKATPTYRKPPPYVPP